MRPSCSGSSSRWSIRLIEACLPWRKRHPSELAISQDRPIDLRFGLPLGWYWCQHSMAAVHQVFGLGLRDARRQRRLLSRAGAAGGDLFVAAAQVMDTAIATDLHVEAPHTKAWK